MNDPAVKTEKLTVKYGSFTAVDNLNLGIERGTVYGLLGPNGAGKTTAIKVLCGLLKPSSGNASILGVSMPDKNVLSRFGYMPQEIAICHDLTVWQNMTLFGELYGLTKKQIEEKGMELLALVDLVKWKKGLVQNLSGGMKRRVSLICGMIHNPELLILDEPTVGVDPELRASFWDYFDNLKKNGHTILITTHYLDEAYHCDRVGLMRSGILIADDAPMSIVKETGTTSLEDAFLKLARAAKNN